MADFALPAARFPELKDPGGLDDSELLPWLSDVASIINTRLLGVLGDPLDHPVTVRELSEAQIGGLMDGGRLVLAETHEYADYIIINGKIGIDYWDGIGQASSTGTPTEYGNLTFYTDGGEFMIYGQGVFETIGATGSSTYYADSAIGTGHVYITIEGGDIPASPASEVHRMTGKSIMQQDPFSPLSMNWSGGVTPFNGKVQYGCNRTVTLSPGTYVLRMFVDYESATPTPTAGWGSRNTTGNRLRFGVIPL